MTAPHEIDRTIHPVATPADTLPNTAGLEHFAASVNHGGSNAPDVDCITAADPFASFHSEGDRA